MLRSLILTVCLGIFSMQDVSAVSWWDMTPQDVREKINQRCMNTEAPIPTVGAVENRTIENSTRSTPIRVYLPNQEKDLPIILLIHGGAWVGGNLDTHDNLARYLCSQVEALVISVGYTNAPEGKYPLQLQQSLDALTWIIDPSNEYAADSSRIAVVGDSAGGNMSAALCLMLRDQQGPKVDLQVLINPAPDLTCKGTITPQNDALDMLRWQAFQYLTDPKDANYPYVSPLRAENLNHLPPALVILAENDDLREAGQHYADRLLDAGVITQVYCQKGVNHLAGDGARASLKARESLDVAVDALRRAFTKTETPHLDKNGKANMSISESSHISQAANQYLAILNRIGQKNNCRPEEITPLCANRCRKVRNGKVLFEGSDFFADQLQEGKQWLGAWSIEMQELLISPESRTATIRYKLASEKEGDLMIIAILHFDSDYLINEINEVHNKLET